MTDQTDPTGRPDPAGPRRSRRGAVVIVVVLALVIAAVVTIGLLTAGRAKPGTVAGPTTSTGAVPSSSATPVPITTGTPEPVKTSSSSSSSTPTPQPTKTATISKPTAVPIKEELTASVTRMQAVTGTADGPGEIGGPSVRFTITIKNTTGRTFSLANTVVNAYYGSADSPAVQLRMPGGKDFPASVKNGASATGVYLFNIPKKDRGAVRVTVDTSVQTPVIAFEGAAPRS